MHSREKRWGGIGDIDAKLRRRRVILPFGLSFTEYSTVPRNLPESPSSVVSDGTAASIFSPYSFAIRRFAQYRAIVLHSAELWSAHRPTAAASPDIIEVVSTASMGSEPIVNAKYTKSGMLYQSSCINEL